MPKTITGELTLKGKGKPQKTVYNLPDDATAAAASNALLTGLQAFGRVVQHGGKEKVELHGTTPAVDISITWKTLCAADVAALDSALTSAMASYQCHVAP